MENNEPALLFWPPINSFEDTGPVWHAFGDGSKVMAEVVQSNDSEGYAINLEITDADGNNICQVTLDRFAALCVADVLIKNIMNQQEVCNAELDKRNRAFRERQSMGQGKEN